MNAVQIEQLWGMIHHITSLARVAVTGYCLTRFVKPFLSRGEKAWLAGAAYALLLALLYCVPQELPSFLAYFSGTAAAFAVLILLERRNVHQKIFLSVTFLALRYLSISMGNTIYLTLHRLIVDMPTVTAQPVLQLGLFALLRLFDLGLSFAFIALSVSLILKAYRKKEHEMRGKELLLLLTPSVSALLMQMTIQYYTVSIPGVDIPGAWLSFLQEGVGFCAILATVVLFEQVKSMREDEKQRQLLFRQIGDIRQHILEVEKLYLDARALRHDMGNHIQTILGLQERGESAAAQTYALELAGRLGDSLPEVKTGNPVTDVILSEKSREAQEKGIDFTWDFHYPENAGVDAFDMGVILNNILSNAITAAQGCHEPMIRLKAFRRKNAFMIETQNSYQGEIRIDTDTGLPVTSKEDPTGHGVGLLSVKQAAEQYHGGVEIEYDGNIFCLSILLLSS